MNLTLVVGTMKAVATHGHLEIMQWLNKQFDDALILAESFKARFVMPTRTSSVGSLGSDQSCSLVDC